MNWGFFGIPRLGLRPVTSKGFQRLYEAQIPTTSDFDTMVANYFRSA
jgi:hypothetical protein